MGSNKHKKLLSKVLLSGVILTMVGTDIAPAFSYAKDVPEVGEETISESLNSQDTEEEPLEDSSEEVYVEDGVEKNKDNNLGNDKLEEQETDDTGEVPKLETESHKEIEPEVVNESELQTEQPTSRMMMASEQIANTYVMATDADFSGTTNGNFRYIGDEEYVEIPHTIKGVNVTSYYSMFNESKVKGVKSTNKNISGMHNMFRDFQGVSLDVSHLDTSGVRDFSYMFSSTIHQQTNLRELIGLDTFDTSNATAMNRMFYRSMISDIDVSSFNTSKVSNMEAMFEDTQDISLDVSNLDTSNVNNMSSMFSKAVTREVDVSNFNTSKVTTMSHMFNEMYATTITGLENFNTERVTSMHSMFRYSKATDINTRSFNTSNVTNMESMFAGVLDDVLDLTNFDTSKVLNMNSMFNDSKTKKLNLTSFNTSNVKSMNSMFRNAQAEELNLISFDTTKVTDMIYMFRNSLATKIDLSSFDTRNVEKMSQMFNNSRVELLDLTGFNTQKVTDMGQMFQDSRVQKIDLSTFSTKRLTDMSNMFSGSYATEIVLGSFDTTYVTNMNSMFKDTKVKQLDLSSFDMRSVNDTKDMFQNTTATKGIARASADVEKFNKSENKPSTLTFKPLYELATDDDFSGFYNGIFKYIGDAEYVEMPHKIKGTNITSYKGLFENTAVKGVISTNTKVTDMSTMFKGNTSNKLDVSTLNTESVTTMEGMFQDTKTTSINVTGFTTDKVTNISNMFKNTKVKELDLGSFDLTKVSNTDNVLQNTTAEIGYARTEVDLTKLDKSLNKPTKLNFTIWGIITTQNTESWTKEPVEVNITAVSDKVGVGYVEMVNETGRNYLLNSKNFTLFSTNNGTTHPMVRGYDSTVGANYMYGRHIPTNKYALSTYVNSTYSAGRGTQYSEDLYPIPEEVTYSISVMSEEPIIVGFRNGEKVTLVPNQWTRISTLGSYYTGRPDGIDVPPYSKIPIGTKLYYKDFKIEKGTVATPWKPAPEDSDSTSDKKDTFKVYENGTYIFRATDTLGDTKSVTHRVNNIDTDSPTATLTSSPEGWTSQDVKIYVNAKDDLSGVDYITTPKGEKVYQDTVEYPVSDNGTYEFKVTDKAGNTTSYKETITNIDKSVPKLSSKVENTEWTRDTVNLIVESEDSASGLSDIVMATSPVEGRNYLANSNIDVVVDENTPFRTEQKHISMVSGLDLTKTFAKKTMTLTYDLNRPSDGDKNPNFIGNLDDQASRFGIHGAVQWDDTSGKLSRVTGYPYAGMLTGHSDDKRESQTSIIENGVYDRISAMSFALQPFARPSKGSGEVWKLDDVKLEFGDTPTPWTPAPEDIKLINNKKIYPVATNGLYTFKATYNNGSTSETSVNVTNIDRTKPEVTIAGNVEDWTEEDKLTLKLTAKDTQSGVESITLPNGKVMTGVNSVTYDVTKNGTYEFTVTDKVGNTTTHTETVEYLMIPYIFYIYDNKGLPVKGAEFELMRDGEFYKKAVSATDGLVTFGKVPPDGKYQVRQVTAPGGVVLDPKDIENGDFTEPVEVVTYPRGIVLPGTGTSYVLVGSGVIGLTLLGIAKVRSKRKKTR